MKLKQLLASALLLCSAGAWAQTDVTSTYLTNADFEGEYTSYSKPSSDRDLYQPEGWTITYSNGEANDLTSLNSSCTQWNQFSGKPQPTNGGNNTYWIRFRWGSSESLQLTQSVTLPAGQYTVSADAYFNGANNAQATIFAGENTKAITTTSWTNYTLDFVLAEEKTINIGFKLKQNSQQESIVAFDNFTLTYTAIVVKEILQTAISAATKANIALEGTLASAIATAQGVYNDEDATQEEVNAAAETLNAAVNTAMATASNIDVTDLFLINADLSSTEGWTAYASGASGTNYQDYSNGLIGTYNVRFNPATVDETHLATEYCFGFECRWSTNYASYYQTTDPVPAGVYTLSYDVQNVNGSTTKASYNNLFYLEVGGNKVTDTVTEWMQGGSSWTTHTIRITVEEAAPLTLSFGFGTGSNNIGAANTPAIYVSHVKLNYSGFLAGAKAAYDEAVANAETAMTECPNVTGDELTALNAELEKAEPTTIEGYNTATEAIEAATATLTAAKASYDAYVEANGIATTLGAESVTAPTTAAEAVTRAQELYVNIDTKVNSSYFDVTELYAGSFSGSLSSTTTGQHWSNDGSVSYLDNWGSGNISASQDVTLPAGSYVLKVAGRGAADAVVHKAWMEANGTTVNFVNNGDTGKGIATDGSVNYGGGTFANENVGRGWEWRFIPVELDKESTVTVTLHLDRSGGNTWGSFCDFTILLSNDGAADSDDYEALNAAIATAEGKTLGFEENQYAPYNNIEALATLAAAKAIDQEKTNLKALVADVTEELKNAEWTVNETRVSIIYNGLFATVAEGQNYPDGWTRTNGWGQMQSGLEGDFATAYYNQPGSLQYGNQGLYTMPLEENYGYTVEFYYRSHENNSNKGVTVSVYRKDNPEVKVLNETFGGNSSTSEWKSVQAYFPITDAGNYVLEISNNGNTWMTNVFVRPLGTGEHGIIPNRIESPFFEEYGIYDGGYKDELYTDAYLERSYKEDTWNTFVVPFDMSNEDLTSVFGNEVMVAEFTGDSGAENSVCVTFDPMATPAITANKPVLLKFKSTQEKEFDFNEPIEFELGLRHITICDESEAKVEGTSFFDFTAVYKYFDDTDDENPIPLTIPAGEYFIANNALYKSKGETTIKPFRAYMKSKDGNSEVKEVRLFIDGIETAISEINGVEKAENGAIFNIAGQRVNKAQKGLYIMNGKKVIVK